MARPKRIRLETPDNRTTPGAPGKPLSDEMRKFIEAVIGHPLPPDPPPLSPEAAADCDSFRRQVTLDSLHVDPKNSEPLSRLFAPVILNRGSEAEKTTAGQILVEILAHGTAEEAGAFFKRVLTLKKESENPPPPNSYVYYAYSMFIEENGFEPTRSRLKKYILARRSIYKVVPEATDTKGWLRLWDESGLFMLE
ncbi:MAG: hypothetical protein WCO57_14210 [Verrucomicrobiota bacterium]